MGVLYVYPELGLGLMAYVTRNGLDEVFFFGDVRGEGTLPVPVDSYGGV
jgi:hypothetical protein